MRRLSCRGAWGSLQDSVGDDEDALCVVGGPAAVLHASWLRNTWRVLEQVLLCTGRWV